MFVYHTHFFTVSINKNIININTIGGYLIIDYRRWDFLLVDAQYSFSRIRYELRNIINEKSDRRSVFFPTYC